MLRIIGMGLVTKKGSTLMHDSGKRQEFDTGAIRDTAENKPRPDLASPFAEERVGLHLAAGAEKYDERNWEKGIPISRCIASMKRHIMQYQMGMRDEDHLAAIVCNSQFIMHYEEMIKRGILPAELSDMPDYSPRIHLTPRLEGEVVGVKEMDDIMQLQLLGETEERAAENSKPPVSKVTGQSLSKTVGGQFKITLSDAIAKDAELIDIYKNGGDLRSLKLPDDNKCKRKAHLVPVCDICNVTAVKYYRLDLDKFYCTLCYDNNRIDLKPVIRS